MVHTLIMFTFFGVKLAQFFCVWFINNSYSMYFSEKNDAISEFRVEVYFHFHKFRKKCLLCYIAEDDDVVTLTQIFKMARIWPIKFVSCL